jgi:hypothetical protein
MNIRLNTIWFIFLLFLLIGVASAADLDNETLHQSTEQEICQASPESQDCLEASNVNVDKLELSIKQSVSANKIKVNIKTRDVNMRYKDGSKFTVELKNQYNQPMKKSKV